MLHARQGNQGSDLSNGLLIEKGPCLSGRMDETSLGSDPANFLFNFFFQLNIFRFRAIDFLIQDQK